MNKQKIFSYANCISYTRIVLLLASVLQSQNNWFFPLYAASYILDAFDGYVARLMNETSQFGAVMDMVTDRVSTAVLLSLLQKPYWLCIMILDISSHWVYTHSLEKTQSHKKSKNKFLSWYYEPVNLFLVCFFTELYCFLNLMCERNSFWQPIQSVYIFSGCVFGIKQILNGIHLYLGLKTLLYKY